MKNRISLLILTLALTGCGLFQKVEKDKQLTENSTLQVATKDTKEADQGIITTKEVWGFNTAKLGGNFDFGNFKAPDLSTIGNDIDGLKDALRNSLADNTSLRDLLKNGIYSKETTEKKAATKDTNEKSTSQADNKQEIFSIKKEPGVNWTLIIIVCAAVFFLVLFGVVIYFLRAMKKEISLIKSVSSVIIPK